MKPYPMTQRALRSTYRIALGFDGRFMPVSYAEFHVGPQYTGLECWWDFKPTRKRGASANIMTSGAQMPMPGQAVASVSNVWSPAPARGIIGTDPTSGDLNPTETVHACLCFVNASLSGTIHYDTYDGSSGTCCYTLRANGRIQARSLRVVKESTDGQVRSMESWHESR